MVRPAIGSNVSRGGSPAGEEIQRISMNKEPLVDSKRFRRSKRLQNILGRMRESQEEERGLPISKPEVVKTTGNQHYEVQNVVVSDEMRAVESASIGKEGRAGNETGDQRDDSGNVVPLTDGEETRDDEEWERETKIREQITVALRDQMQGNVNLNMNAKPSLQIDSRDNRSLQMRSDPEHNFPQVVAAQNTGSGTSPRGREGRSRSPQKAARSSRSPRKNERAEMKRSEFHSSSDSSDTQTASDTDSGHRNGFQARKGGKKALSRGKVSGRGAKLQSRSLSSDDMENESVGASESTNSSNSEYGSALSSSSGYSTTSSMRDKLMNDAKLRQTTKKRSAGNKVVKDEVVPRPSKGSSFVAQMVEKLNGTFGLPENVKNHAKSYPIIPETGDGDTRDKSQDDDNSIVGAQSTRGNSTQRPAPPIKLTTIGRRQLMQELRARSKDLSVNETSNQPLNENPVPKTEEPQQPQKPKGKGKKVTSQVIKAHDNGVEAIPTLISADTESVQSHQIGSIRRNTCGVPNCGSFIPFLEKEVQQPKFPVRVNWNANEFLTVNEALIALDEKEEWECVSTLASTKDASVDVNKNRFQTNQFATNQESLNRNGPKSNAQYSGNVPSQSSPVPQEIQAKQASMVKPYIQTAPGSTSMEAVARQREVTLAISSDSEERRQKANVPNDDDGASLAYSLFTEDGKEILEKMLQDKIAGAREDEENEDDKLSPSDSDDSSMVPLRHGQRENVKRPPSSNGERSFPSGGAVDSLATKNNDDKEFEGQVEELAAVLSLSDESIDLIAKPEQQVMGHQRSSSSQSAVKVNRFASNSDDHQVELFAKIEEFQRRRAQGLTNSDRSMDRSVGSARNVKQLPPPPTVELPKASKKIAQAYVDALSKKLGQSHPTQNTDDSNESDLPNVQPPVNALFDAMSVTTAGDTSKVPRPHEDKMVRKENLASEASVPTSVVAPSLQGSNQRLSKAERERQRVLSLLSEICQGQKEGDTIATVSTSTERKVDVEDLVSRIDGVVQRLVMSGKLGTTAKSPLEQRTLQNNTAELLQNLAILRARKASGWSERNSPRTPTSEASVSLDSTTFSVPTTIPLEGLIRPGSHTTMQRQGQQQQHQPETKTLPLSNLPQASDAILNTSSRQSGSFSFDNVNLANLRARRDQAAKAVRERAQRLSDWSTREDVVVLMDEKPILVESRLFENTASPVIESRPSSASSAKRNGPPRPEVLSSKKGVPKQSADPIVRSSYHRESMGFSRASSLGMTTIESSGAVSQGSFGLGVSRDALEGFGVDMVLWEEDQLRQLPTILGTESGGDKDVMKLIERASYETDGDSREEDDDEDDDEEDDDDDDDFDSTYDDETEYASDDDSERLARIESMIRELRARRKGLQT